MSKELIVFILDVSPYMNEKLQKSFNEETVSKLDLAKFCIKNLISDKIILNPSHEISLIILNSGETHNKHDFNNIFTINPSETLYNVEDRSEWPQMSTAGVFFKPSTDAVKFIKLIEASNVTDGNMLDALTLAISSVEEQVGKKKYTKRLFVLTDGSCNITDDAQTIDQLKNAQTNLNYTINFICIDFEKLDNQPDHRNELQKKNLVVFKQFESLDCVSVFNSSDAYEIVNNFKTKKHANRSLGKLELVLGNAVLEVNQFKKAKRETIPTLKRINKNTNNKIKNDRKYYEIDDQDKILNESNPIEPENLANVQVYGNRKVVFDDSIQTSLKTEENKGIFVICAVPKQNISSFQFLSDTNLILPIAKDTQGIKSFKSLVQVCLNSDKYLICKQVNRANAKPKLVALIPKIKQSNSSHMFIVQSLPFFQDVREYTFPAMPKVKDDEVVMFEQLIDSMQLVKEEYVDVTQQHDDDMQNLNLDGGEGVMDDGGRNDGRRERKVELTDMADVEEIFNPSQQQFCQSMMKIIENPDMVHAADNNSGKSEIPSEIQNLYHPTYDFDQNSIDKLCMKIKEKLKISKIDKKVKRQRIQLSDLLNINLLNDTAKQAEVLYAKGNDLNAKDAKDAKTPNDFNDDFETADRLNPSDAINHFSGMLNYTKADLTMKALRLMTQFIDDLSTDLNANQESVQNCVRALRHACVNEDEPEVFNDYQRRFKEKQGDSDVWVLLKAKKVGLVTNGESVSSGVTHKENVAWLSGVDEADVAEDGQTDTATEEED